MARTKISEFSATPANNTDIDSINIAEGCAPSGINDAIRELMAQLKDFQTGAVGDSFNGPIGTTTAAAGAFTTLAASGAVTLSGGTANGVTYLNGSKVLTSGSALTFDGTDLKFASGSGLFTNTSDGSDTGTLAIGGGGANSSARGGVIEFYGNENASAGVVDITSGNVANSYVRIQGRSSTSYVRFDINASEQMRLTSTGLGIGTTAPKEKLDSRGAAVFSGDNATGTNAFGTAEGLLLSTGSGVARITAVSNGSNNVNLALRSLSSGGAVTALTINSTGAIALNGAVTTATGAGITFPATQSASSDANTLDDYEEGTFTATMSPLTSGSITLSAATGAYTKIGRQVTVTGQFNTSAVSTPLGRLRISGLPFTTASGTQFESRAVVGVVGGVAIIAIDSWIPSGGSFIDIYPTGTTTDSYASNIDASTSVYISATYFTT